MTWKNLRSRKYTDCLTEPPNINLSKGQINCKYKNNIKEGIRNPQFMKIHIVYLFTNLDIRGIIELFCCCMIRIIMFFLSDAQLLLANLIIPFRFFTEELYSSQPHSSCFLGLDKAFFGVVSLVRCAQPFSRLKSYFFRTSFVHLNLSLLVLRSLNLLLLCSPHFL